MVSFVLRAVAREVVRCRAQLPDGLETRIAAGDLAEAELLDLLTEEEKKKWGL